MKPPKRPRKIFSAPVATGFAIGIFPMKDRLRAFERRRKEWRALNKSEMTGLIPHSFQPYSWFILPDNLTRRLDPRVMLAHSFADATRILRFYRPSEAVDRARVLIQYNEWIRRRFKGFVVKWRRTHMTRANEEDLITMERPVHEVVVYDWKERRSYHFEAMTIFRCIMKRILSHAGFFPNPLEPANPYTNVLFTAGQLHSIIDQLRLHSIGHWALDALRNSVYNWGDFMNVYAKPLRMESLEVMFSDNNDSELQDTLYDYMDCEYNINLQIFNANLYLWAVAHAMDSPHMIRWRKLCYDYYRVQILYENQPIRRKALQLAISFRSVKLCRHSYEVSQLIARYKNASK